MLIQVPEMCFDPLRIGWQCGLRPRSGEEGLEWQGSCRGERLKQRRPGSRRSRAIKEARADYGPAL